MFRSTASFVALSCLLTAQPVAAANPDCAVFGEIAGKAAVERQAKTEMMQAMVKISKGYTGKKERFAAAVPLLVDWVWSLPKAQLSGDVGAAYQNACEAQ